MSYGSEVLNKMTEEVKAEIYEFCESNCGLGKDFGIFMQNSIKRFTYSETKKRVEDCYLRFCSQKIWEASRRIEISGENAEKGKHDLKSLIRYLETLKQYLGDIKNMYEMIETEIFLSKIFSDPEEIQTLESLAKR